MDFSTQIKPISYLKANAAEILLDLAERREPMVITQNGEAKAVIQDVASFEETQRTLAWISHTPPGFGRMGTDFPGFGRTTMVV